MVEMIVFKKKYIAKDGEFKKVEKIANTLLDVMNNRSTYNLICKANIPKAPSSSIQSCILKVATKMGFKDEAKGLFSNYENRLRWCKKSCVNSDLA